jgi:hypothetical protein
MNGQNEQTEKRSPKKKAAAATAAVLAVLLALGGTYMWQDFTQHKTGEASGGDLSKYSVRLIENFQEKTDWKTTDDALTKEISVKNTGGAGYSDVYVRIQLKEYMDMTPMIVEKTAERYLVNSSGNFLTYDTQDAALSAHPGATVTQLTDAVGGITDKWFVQTQAGDDNGQYGDYVTTVYEAGETTYVVGDESMKDARNDASEKHNVVASGEEATRNAECDYPARNWEEDADNSSADYIEWLLNTEKIEKLSDWDGDPVAKWIIDDRVLSEDDGVDGGRIADAWIYWGIALTPGTETDDFIKSITLTEQPDGAFYYAIHTELEALSKDELRGEDTAWEDMPQKVKDAYIFPIVTSFKVAAGGAKTQDATDDNFDLRLAKNSAAREIILTGIVTGTDLLDNPQTTWSKSGDNAAWGADAGDSKTYIVTIPADGTGTMTVTATAKDDETKTITVSIEVVTYTLIASESGLLLGSANVEANAYTETEDANLTVNLTSPVGAATERYFTTSTAVAADKWVIDSTGTEGGTVTKAQVTEDLSYKVVIPTGTTGTATLTVDGVYKITFNITNGVEAASTLKAGETFAADGYEWRVLMKNADDEVLVISEHAKTVDYFEAASTDSVYKKWSESAIRTKVAALLNTTFTTLNEKAIPKNDIMTRTVAYQSMGSYEATTDKIFLLSMEEAYYAGTNNVLVGSEGHVTTGETANRTNGNTVIFADAFARKFLPEESLTNGGNIPEYTLWWSRSPSRYEATNDVSIIYNNMTGDAITDYVYFKHCIRPALWLDLDAA